MTTSPAVEHPRRGYVLFLAIPLLSGVTATLAALLVVFSGLKLWVEASEVMTLLTPLTALVLTAVGSAYWYFMVRAARERNLVHGSTALVLSGLLWVFTVGVAFFLSALWGLA